MICSQKFGFEHMHRTVLRGRRPFRCEMRDVRPDEGDYKRACIMALHICKIYNGK